MFYRGYSALASLGRPETMPTPRSLASAARDADAVQRAMSRALEGMPLSARLQDPAAYLRLQQARRRSLEALLTAEPDEAVLRRAVDLMGMICEESAWSMNPERAPFEDDAHPVIDVQSAETALLLGWSARAFGDRLPSRVTGKLVYEVRRRVFAPVLAHQDYPFMRARGSRPLTILSDILLAAMLLETNEQRRASVMKLALRLIDQAISARADKVEPLEEALSETAAVTDLAALLRRITRGELDLTPDYPDPEWLDQLLYPWLEGDWFADPAGEGMRPRLSGAELFRVGLCANDDAVTALGASLHRRHPLPSSGVTGRLMDLSCRQMLEAETRKAPRIKCGATPGNRVMVSRFSGMTCAMHTGGGRGNAGSLLLFCDGAPVLVEDGDLSSLPVIGGHSQLARPDLPCEADYDLRQERDQMSVELTSAYPAGLARSIQRTAMIRRQDAAVTLVDAFDLNEPASIAFRFIIPRRPEYIMGGLRLGGVDLRWEGDLKLDIADTGRSFPMPDGETASLWRVTLTAPAPVTRAFYTFTFARP